MLFSQDSHLLYLVFGFIEMVIIASKTLLLTEGLFDSYQYRQSGYLVQG